MKKTFFFVAILAGCGSSIDERPAQVIPEIQHRVAEYKPFAAIDCPTCDDRMIDAANDARSKLVACGQAPAGNLIIKRKAGLTCAAYIETNTVTFGDDPECLKNPSVDVAEIFIHEILHMLGWLHGQEMYEKIEECSAFQVSK